MVEVSLEHPQLLPAHAPPIHNDRVTLAPDYAIEELSGRPLDGEIFNPYPASVPSGDGRNGGLCGLSDQPTLGAMLTATVW